MRSFVLCGLLALSLFARAEAPVETLSGQVTTPDGKAMPGAVVYWIGRDDEGQCTLIASGTTAVDGGFLLSDAAKKTVLYPYASALTEAPGWGLSCANRRKKDESLEITLQPLTELQAPFLDEAGKPLADLPITLADFYGRGGNCYCMIPAELQPHFTHKTDAAGVLTLPGMPQGMYYELKVTDENCARLMSRQDFQPQNAPVIRLPACTVLPGATLSGKIIEGATGKPLAGIHVSAAGGSGWGDAVTDADGRYTIRQLRPGRYTVRASLTWAQHRQWTYLKREKIDVGKGAAVQGIDLTLIHGAVLKGKVTGEDGTPLKEMCVGVQDGADCLGMMKTGTDGQYLLHLPAGQYKAYFAMGGPLPGGYLQPLIREVPFSVKDGETATADFLLPRSKAKPVHGRVLGPDGKPAPRAEITAVPFNEQDYMMETQTAVADANGEFTFEPYAVKLQARCGKLATPDLVPLPNGGEVILRLEAIAFASISGLVTDGDEQPLAGVAITASAYQPYDIITGEVTDATGRYTLHGLWPKRSYMLAAVLPGYSQGHANAATKSGETLHVEEMILYKLNSFVAGTVTDAQGKALPGMNFNIQSQLLPFTEVTTDLEGKFKFAGVAGDTCTLYFTLPDGKMINQVVVVKGQTDVVVVVK